MSVSSNRCRLGRRRAVSCIAEIAMFGWLAGCASTALDAQWADAQLPAHLLRGAKVMVLCEAQDVVIRRLCQDQIAAGLTQRGAVPVVVPENISVPIAQASIDPQLLGAARDAGAKAVFSVVVGVSAQTVSPGFSIGIGGFGFGANSGVGVGVSAPIGGGKVNAGYSANGRVTEVASARLLWTARATAPPSSNVAAQLSELSAAVLAAADKAGMF